MFSQANLARRVRAAFQFEYQDHGLLAPLEALGAIYPRYGRSMQLLNRAGSTRPSPGEDDIDMGIGTYFAAPQMVIEAGVRALRAGHTHYLDLPELKEAIATKLAEENRIIVDPEQQVLLTGGARTGMILAALALLDPGDAVLVPDPDYIGLVQCSRIVEAEVLRVPMSKVGGMFQFDPQRLADAVTRRSRLIMFSNPNNPTGYLYNRTDLEAIADLAERHNLYVLANELYDQLVFEGAQHMSLASLPGMMDRTITIQGLSKIYDMSGLRVGWTVASQSLTQVLTDLRFLACQSLAPSVSQYAGVAALSNPTRQNHVREVLDLYTENRHLTTQMLDSFNGVLCPNPMAGHFAFADFSSLSADDVKIARFLKEKTRVLTVPGSVWGLCGRGHLRLALANSPAVQVEGLARLREGIKLLACGLPGD